SAWRLLLLPDLLVHELTRFTGAEISNLSTTSLMDARTRDWSDELIDAVRVPRRLFPDPVEAGTRVGSWRGLPVAAVGSHDTASAFLGVTHADPTRAGGRDVFVSAGSWVLVGTDRPAPDTSEQARLLNF